MTAIDVAPPTLSSSDPAAEAEIEQSRARERVRMDARALSAALAIGGAFLVAALAILALAPGRSIAPAEVVALTVAFALALRVVFEIGPGLAVPSELLLVPMLFLLPLRLVPLCVAAGFVLRDAPELVRGRVSVERLFLRFVNCWYVVGPVLVLWLAHAQQLRWSAWFVYVTAFASQLALDFASSGAWMRLALGERPLRSIRLVAWCWLVDLTLVPVGAAFAFAGRSRPVVALGALPLVGLIAFFARERKTRIDHALELSQAYRGTALLLGDVVEADDEYTGLHSRDVVSLVLGVCDELGLSPRERRDAEFVALLHDVGKIRIPAEIINKPGPLTAEERTVMQTHTIEGERLLAQVGGLLGQVGRIVRSCHERWDGAGYPDGLAGDAIPLIARIVCACDAYSAITTTRPYREARTSAEAIVELRACAGAHFDPAVVEALARVL